MQAAIADGTDAAYLAPTFFLDSDAAEVAAFAEETTRDLPDDRAKAVALYYAIRDGIRYDAYRVTFDRPGFRASTTLSNGFGFCISKAALLAAAARAIGIPARLGFGDVRNHLTTEKLRAQMGSDIFTFHGYTELWLGERWVKATPAFNRELCEKFGVLPLEFDGETDSLFQANRPDGGKHMEYLRDRGSFADIPFDLIQETWAAAMPGSAERFDQQIEGDFAEDGARERDRG